MLARAASGSKLGSTHTPVKSPMNDGATAATHTLCDISDIASTDPVKAKWLVQTAKVSHTTALTGKRSLGRERRCLKEYAAEADSLSRSEGPDLREHADLNEAIEKLSTQNG